MTKKILIAIAVVALLWSIPATRAKMITVSQPVLVKLGPVGEKMLGPARKYNAKTTCALYLRMVAEAYNEGHMPPTPREFTRWIKTKTESDGLDPWGNRYWIERERGTLTVGSNGPDGRRGNGDDISQTVPF